MRKRPTQSSRRVVESGGDDIGAQWARWKSELSADPPVEELNWSDAAGIVFALDQLKARVLEMFREIETRLSSIPPGDANEACSAARKEIASLRLALQHGGRAATIPAAFLLGCNFAEACRLAGVSSVLAEWGQRSGRAASQERICWLLVEYKARNRGARFSEACQRVGKDRRALKSTTEPIPTMADYSLVHGKSTPREDRVFTEDAVRRIGQPVRWGRGVPEERLTKLLGAYDRGRDAFNAFLRTL
jgi:hypothetical protein